MRKPRQRKPFGRHDPTKPYRPRTEAQDRALQIMRLRGFYCSWMMLTGWRARLFRWLVDQELEAYGVESQSTRIQRERAERLADRDAEIDLDRIPF